MIHRSGRFPRELPHYGEERGLTAPLLTPPDLLQRFMPSPDEAAPSQESALASTRIPIPGVASIERLILQLESFPELAFDNLRMKATIERI